MYLCCSICDYPTGILNCITCRVVFREQHQFIYFVSNVVLIDISSISSDDLASSETESLCEECEVLQPGILSCPSL